MMLQDSVLSDAVAVFSLSFWRTAVNTTVEVAVAKAPKASSSSIGTWWIDGYENQIIEIHTCPLF